jgi:hypothetical protein
MASPQPHHEARENDGLLESTGERELERAGRQIRWSNLNNADIKYQSDAGCAVSWADPTAFRGESKRETRRVKNNLIEWRDKPSVSGLISLAIVYEQYVRPICRFCPSRSPRCSSILSRTYCVDSYCLCYIVTHSIVGLQVSLYKSSIALETVALTNSTHISSTKLYILEHLLHTNKTTASLQDTDASLRRICKHSLDISNPYTSVLLP